LQSSMQQGTQLTGQKLKKSSCQIKSETSLLKYIQILIRITQKKEIDRRAK
jgi:hypothetical protein